MTSIAKLKDRARKHEQKEDWEAAIRAYQKVLEQEESADEVDLELGLYNRIGDLLLRLGQTDRAVTYYETAADKYAESGFLNNAIALCNKALRHRPERSQLYLKLSRLCSEQGFQTDARRWILEYAERRVRAGQVDEALTGLEDFADMSQDPEVRETLAQYLASHDHPEEAVEQLREAHALRVAEGDEEAAARLVERARAIDPSVQMEAQAPPPLPGFDDEPVDADEPDAGLGLETRPGETAPLHDADEVAIEGLETGAGEVADEQPEPGAVPGVEGFESGHAGPDESEPVGESVGGLETFDAAAEAGDVEEEAEPLPLIETGYDQAEEAEEADDLDEVDEADEDVQDEEPLPLLDDAEPEPVVAEGDARPGDAVEEPAAVEEHPVREEPDAGAADRSEDEEPYIEPLDSALDGPLNLDVSGIDRWAPDESSLEPMELDLGSLSVGGAGGGEDASGPPDDLDVEAVLQRSRELVSRGLTNEAMRELRLLSGSGAEPSVFRDALAVVNEVIRHDANDLAALQRRVEYSAKTGDDELLIDAYIDLADALARLGAETKAQAMYGRVLDLDPGNEAAREALGVPEEGEADPVDLDAVLEDVEPEEGSGEGEPEGDPDPNFDAMLSQFKAKVGDKADGDEAGDHYDLGLAFKEMGLIDEAIAEFQNALTRGPEQLRVYEELGQCYMQKNQYNVAVKVLSRALKIPHADEAELLGVYYHLGQCHEELGQREEARNAYTQVLAIDGSFADVPDRVARL